MTNTVFVIFALLFVLLGFFVLPRLLVKRAAPSVIRAFRHCGATSVESACTVEEIGLTPLSFTQRMFKRRDYKTAALNALKLADIVRSTPEGRLYLDESRLRGTTLAKQ